MRYAIPECNIEGLEKKIVRIRNKCAKYGCEFKYERVGEHFDEAVFPKYDDFGGVCGTYKQTIKFIDIEAEGTAKVNGWKFAASLDHTSKGNVIRGVEGIEIPKRFYDCGPWCEHCKTHRDRVNSFIVVNDDGEFKQVGRACLKDFTGGLSAEDVALYESFIKEIEAAREFTGGYGKTYYGVDDYMVCVAEAIRIYGYVRNQDSGISTSDRAWRLYKVENGLRYDKYDYEDYEEAVSKGFNVKRQESIDLVKKVREWIVNNENDTNYFHNLKVVCSMDWCDGAKLGLLASAFPAYNKDLEIQAEKIEREKKQKEAGELSKHVGEVGKRISFVPAEVRCLTSWETMYGYTYVFKLVDGDGNQFTWKTSNWIDQEFEVKKVTGTVKEHKEYQGVKQTELTRCKVEYGKRKGAKEPEISGEDPMRKIFEALDKAFELEEVS